MAKSKVAKTNTTDGTYEYPEDIRLLGYGEQIVTETKEKYSIMDVLVMASHGMLMRVEKCDDGKLLCAKIQAKKITKKQYPGDFNKEVRALELMKEKKIDCMYLPKIRGKGSTADICFYITDHVGQTLQCMLKRHRISATSAFRICRHLIEAMKVIHGIGIVHGNIRPSAILVGGPHERDVVRLFGFQFSSMYPQPPHDKEQIGYPLDKFTPRVVHKGERPKPKHDFEMYLYVTSNFCSFTLPTSTMKKTPKPISAYNSYILMPPIPETVLFKMIDLTTGLPWSKASTLKETISAKEAFWKKYFEQNWGRIPGSVRDNAHDIDKDKMKIEYVAIEHDLDDLLQMLPPRNCFEWELNTPLTTQPQRKGPTLITPLDIAVTKGQSRTVVERCEAVLKPDL